MNCQQFGELLAHPPEMAEIKAKREAEQAEREARAEREAIQAEAQSALIHFERREPAHNWLRFYNIVVTPTLFGGWALVREWGRMGQPGTVRETWFETESAAIEASERIRQRKEKRGYWPTLIDRINYGQRIIRTAKKNQSP